MLDAADEDIERCQRRVGTVLCDKWKIERLLGVGGMAAVYAATHRMGSRAAIKVLHPFVAVSKEMRARFEQEARAVTTLGHPGTVRVLDIDRTEDGAPFMVMELLDGMSLGQRAAAAPVEIGALLGWMQTLLEVLGRAHANGIVHRDIKPDNLFITSDGRLKVLDFGIARMKTSSSVQTKTGAMLGTTSYMAPEQIHGRDVDGRADLFSVGATMFRLLSSRRVHEATNDAEMLIKMGSMPAPPLASVAPSVDPRIAMIVDRALAFDRDSRYPDAATMIEDIRAVAQGQTPPFAAQRSLVAGVATIAAAAPHAAVVGHGSARTPGSNPALEPTHISQAYNPGSHPSVAVTSYDTRTSARRPPIPVPVLVGIGALMILVGGIVATVLLWGSNKPSPAAEDDHEASRALDDEPATRSTSSRKKQMEEELDRARVKEDEPARKGKSKGKGKKKD